MLPAVKRPAAHSQTCCWCCAEATRISSSYRPIALEGLIVAVAVLQLQICWQKRKPTTAGYGCALAEIHSVGAC